ncbi:hypothetical protein K501DRAFT_337223 [Backusella circina FSU 941]|nr:hypothetical protein K501DRAFT_337223 [Backusella circina FSU 941]
MGKVTKDKSRYCTWLVFMNSKWVPFDQINQYRLDQTLGLESTFVDIQDSHFPDVRRVRVFPKVNYLSYLGLKYRISKVMEIDAWSVYESSSTRTTTTSEKSSSSLPEIHYLPVPFNNNNTYLRRSQPPLDAAVRQYSTLYSTVGFKENLDKTMKWLSSHNMKIDKDPNYICDILIRNTDSPISISYKKDSLPNPCLPLTVFSNATSI